MRAPFVLIAAVAVLPLGGCISLGGKPPAQFYTVSADAPMATPAVSTGGSALVIDEPTSAGSLAVRRVAVQLDATRVAYVKGAVWADRPTKLFRNVLAQTLLHRGGALVVTDDAAPPPGARRVDGALDAFGYDAASRTAMVRYVMVVTAGTSHRQMVFEASEPARPTAADIVPALNRAANRVATAAADALTAGQ